MAPFLWVLAPSPTTIPKRSATPYFKAKNSKLTYKSHRMLTRKLLTREAALWYSQYSASNILTNPDEIQNGRINRHIYSEYFQKYWENSNLFHLKSVCLVKSFRMSIRCALYNFEVLTLMMGVTDIFGGRRGTKYQKWAAIACQLATPKRHFFGTP